MNTKSTYLNELQVLYETYKGQEVADAVGVSIRQIQNYLKSANPAIPSKDVVLKIREAFVKHQKGEPIHDTDRIDFKDKYIASLEKQVRFLEEDNKRLEDQLNSATGELRHIAVMNYAMLKGIRMPVAKILAKVEKGDLRSVVHNIDKETSGFYRSGREKGSLIDAGM